MASMGVIPLYGYLCNGISTYQMHPLMNKEGTQHLYVWLELMVYHTSHQRQRLKGVCQFSSIKAWHIIGVLCDCCINLTHALIDELRGVSTLYG